eukprot:25277_1
MSPLILLTFLTGNGLFSPGLQSQSTKLKAIKDSPYDGLPEVAYKRILTDEDAQKVRDQLGYIPSNLVSVAARRSTGDPLVLRTYPLNGGAKRRKLKAEGDLTPFPTHYWFITSNPVSKAVSALEQKGYVAKFESRLMDDPDALHSFIKSHEGYATERWDSILPEHKAYIASHSSSSRMTQMLQYSGIAGTDFESFSPLCEESKPASIKCLHAHYAHYRSQIESSNEVEYPLNIVGEWIHEELKIQNSDLEL